MIVEPIRAALRDPFYRMERRQAGTGMLLLGPAGCLVGAALASMCCLGQIVLYGIPLVVGAEGLLCETDRGTLDGLLLTPASRGRILWAKLLSRMRGLLWFAAACPAVGLLIGAVVAAMAHADDGFDHTVLLATSIGLGVGALVGIQVATQSLTGGALGIYAALLGRTRGKSYLFCLLFGWLMGIYDGVIFMVAYMTFIFGAMLLPLSAAGGASGYGVMLTLVGVGVLAATMLFVGRIVLVNMWLTARLMQYCARHMDLMLLRDA